MIVEKVSIERLQAAPYNPRIELRSGDLAYERLKRSLEEFDLVEPLVWNRTSGNLVGGHQRLKILRARGATEVDVVVVELSQEREKALNIALNNPNLAGDWDLEKLSAVIEELQATPDFDTTLTGFTDEELKGLLLAPQPDDLIADESDEPSSNRVEVRLLVAIERWEELKLEIDGIVERFDVECHVRMPRG